MFETHKLNENGFKEVAEFKNGLCMAISKALLMMPESREKSIFQTKLEEALFFGTKAIAQKDGNHTDVIYPHRIAVGESN